MSLATAYGGNVISHQETNKATTMPVTLVTELQNFTCPHPEFFSRSFFVKADFLFSSIPPIPTIPTKNRNIPYWSCPHCTPSLTLPLSSLKCLQNSNPNIHRKCFKCFGCFRCFISLLDYKIAPFWSKSELNPQTRRVMAPPYYGCGKHPKRRYMRSV